MTERETGGPGGEKTGVQPATAHKTDGAGVATELVIKIELPLLGRMVRGWGAAALTTQQSFLSFGLGEDTGVC